MATTANEYTIVWYSASTSSPSYGTTVKSYTYHGNSSSDARPRTVWNNSEMIVLAQLTELVTAAKEELRIRGETTKMNQVVNKSLNSEVEYGDLNQMITRVAKLRTISQLSSGSTAYKSKLIEVQRALNESQAECVCNCDYWCTCNWVCSCYNQCSCNAQCTCHLACSCHQQCSCYSVCTCNCNNCSCNYGSTPNNTRNRNCPGHSAACVSQKSCPGHSAACLSHSSSTCGGHSASCPYHTTAV